MVCYLLVVILLSMILLVQICKEYFQLFDNDWIKVLQVHVDLQKTLINANTTGLEFQAVGFQGCMEKFSVPALQVWCLWK